MSKQNVRFFIVDNTENTGKPYISSHGFKNSGDRDGSLSFDTKKEAEAFIRKMKWTSWAFVLSETV